MAQRKRKALTTTQEGLTFQRGREIVISIKKVEGKSIHTINNYDKLFNDFDRFFSHRKLMPNVTTEDARNFMKWQLDEKTQFLNVRFRKDKKKGVSINSANSYLRLAKSAYETLVKDGSIGFNPFFSLSKVKQQTKQIEVLSISEVKSIFKAFDKTWYADFRDYVLCHVMMDTFGRINEICQLRKTDVDYTNGTVTFQETKSKLFRIVPISRKVIRMIEELNQETEEFESDYIFISSHNTTLQPATFRKHLKQVCERAGVSKRVHPHIFRHTASTLFLANGGSMRALQIILGHAEISTTMIYSHMLDATIKQQHEQYSPLRTIEASKSIKTRRNKS